MNGGIFISGIYYSSNKDGAEISRWSGKRKIDGKVSKDKQIYLDKVIDRDRPLGAQDTKPRKRRKNYPVILHLNSSRGASKSERIPS